MNRMTQWRKNPAMVWNDIDYSYGDLLGILEIWEKEQFMQEIWVSNVVGIKGDFSPKVCALLLALIKSDKIIVPLTRAAKEGSTEFFDIAETQTIVSFDEYENYKIEHRKIQIKNLLTQRLIQSGEAGLVIFSSGSTGRSKASLHNFKKLLEKLKMRRQRLVTMSFLRFDHIGGINTLFYTFANGGSIVTINNRDPGEVCRLIERHKIELLPTSPTFLNLLLISEAYLGRDLSSLKLISYGTEVMQEGVLKRLKKIFPNVQLLQTYGLSEIGILRSKSRSCDSLWVKVGGEGYETRVVDGVLWLRAQSAMMGYLNYPNPFTEDGWFNTGDAVEVDGEYIRFLGRKSELINVGGEKVFPAEVENVVQMMEEVEDVVVNAEPNPILGHIVIARVKLKKNAKPKKFRKRLRMYCREKLARYKIPQKVFIVSNHMHGERFKKRRLS